MTRVDEELLAQIEDELGQDGVWVAPALRREVTPAQEARIEAAVAEATTPTYVVLVDLDPGDPLTNGDPENLAGMIRDDTGWSGQYVVPALRFGDEAHRLEISSYPDDYGLYAASAVATAEHPDDLAAQTLRALELLESGDAERLYDQMQGEDGTTSSTGTGSGRGVGGDTTGDGIGTGDLLVGVPLALLAVVAVTSLRRRRRRRRAVPSATGASFTLPAAVLSTVRAAEDRRHEARAQRDVLALGEALDAAELDPGRAGSLEAWQAALDHYDVARRILDRGHTPADVVGAIVLARRGRSALDAARRGRVWRPEPGCYLNPLHEGPTTPAPWHHGDTTVRVPACPACAHALEDGAEPEDVLDFVADGRPAHYFHLDLGAWSRTGYGSVDTDLLGRLLERHD